MKRVIAVPSMNAGGLGSTVSPHFGHCDIYTIIAADDDQIMDVSTLPNVPHQQGGCMAPVQYLANNGVTVLLAGGMGMRPLAGFAEVGIDVFKCSEQETVESAVLNLIKNKLPRFVVQHTCGGGGEH